MGQDILNFLRVVVPTKGESVLMALGSAWGFITYTLGGIDVSITWLFGFVILDYFTGFIAALKNGEWCSHRSFKGLFKKFFIFVIIALCVGIDEIMHLGHTMRTCAIYAFTVNEFGSILENIDKLGYGDVIPEPIRKALKNIKERKELN